MTEEKTKQGHDNATRISESLLDLKYTIFFSHFFIIILTLPVLNRATFNVCCGLPISHDRGYTALNKFEAFTRIYFT